MGADEQNAISLENIQFFEWNNPKSCFIVVDKRPKSQQNLKSSNDK